MPEIVDARRRVLVARTLDRYEAEVAPALKVCAAA